MHVFYCWWLVLVVAVAISVFLFTSGKRINRVKQKGRKVLKSLVASLPGRDHMMRQARLLALRASVRWPCRGHAWRIWACLPCCHLRLAGH